MTSRLPTASALERALRCPRSTLGGGGSGGSSVHAERGNVVHAYLADAALVGREEALRRLPEDSEHRAVCEAIRLEELPQGGSRELALAWDWRTDEARVLEAAGHRDYSAATPEEFVGTADYVGRDGDCAVVVDWKTGHRWLGRSVDSWQLRFLALAATRYLGLAEARVAHYYLREDGQAIAEWGTLDAFDLEETADALRSLAEQVTIAQAGAIAGAELVTNEGAWCDYCPSFARCPAKVALARAIGGGALALPAVEGQALTTEEARAAWLALERIEDVAERVKTALRQLAKMTDIDLGDGRILGEVDWPATSVQGDVAYATIREVAGEKTADAACPRKPTLTSIKGACGKELLAQVERAGGLIQISTRQVRVHRRKKAK